MKIDRRKWLKSTALAATAGAILPVNLLGHDGQYANVVNGKLLLNSNENALGPSDQVIKTIGQSVKESNRYPWQTRQILIDKVAQREGIPADYIILGAGSTEILQLAGMAFGARGGHIVSSYPTFPLMMQHATNFEARWSKVPLNEAFSHDLETLAMKARDAQLLYLCNPNNPTGTMIAGDELRDFCHSISKDTMVFVDEAYIEFTPKGLASSLAQMVTSTSNLIVARTFSKIYGLAGLRVGYAFAHPEIIKQLKRYHIGFELNMPITSLYAALTAADDQHFVDDCKLQNQQAKQIVYTAFDAWGVSYTPSHTNFVYFSTDKFGPNIVETLEKHQIMIRDYGDQPGFARVSIGTRDQMEHFVTSLKQFLS